MPGSNTTSRSRRAARARSPAARSRPATRSAAAAVRGFRKELSRVALGFEDFRTFASGAILLDAFFEAGGNLFDTGFVYGAGYTEKLFGDWHTSRGVREEAVLIGKGAHSPLCYPDVIGKQLTQSLDRLQTDYVDVYFMHRDNPDVPVGEFVDAMDAEAKPGPHPRHLRRLELEARRASTTRIAYAERTGKRRPGALSNNFALAEMLDVDLGGLRVVLERRLEGVAHGAPDPELRLVEPGPRLLHRPCRPRQARQ